MKEGSKRTIWKGNVKPEHHITHAFTVGGMKYFNFTDAFNIPCERALDAIDIYEEMSMRCTRTFLLAHVKAVKNLLTANPINIFDIHKLTVQLEERLELVVYPKLIKKLASVYYFDETENPYRYDAKYGEQKIKLWDKEGLEDFFLLNPIRTLIPSYDLSEIGLENYSQITEKIDKIHLESLFTHLSSNQLNEEQFKTLFSTMNTEKTTV